TPRSRGRGRGVDAPNPPPGRLSLPWGRVLLFRHGAGTADRRADGPAQRADDQGAALLRPDRPAAPGRGRRRDRIPAVPRRPGGRGPPGPPAAVPGPAARPGTRRGRRLEGR